LLLSALLNSAGFEACPALIYTGELIPIETLKPWPTLFDHVIAAVKSQDGFIYLDPGDRQTDIYQPPPRLLNKFLLVCDGVASLSRANDLIQPVVDISWAFDIMSITRDSLVANYDINLWYLAKNYYSGTFSSSASVPVLLDHPLKLAGWIIDNYRPALTYDSGNPEQYGVRGYLSASTFENIPDKIAYIPSPLISFLLSNILTVDRIGSYCAPVFYALDEKIVDISNSPEIAVADGDFALSGPNFEYLDSTITAGSQTTYYRSFRYRGGEISAGQFNSLRTHLLKSVKNRYVRLEK